MILKFSTWLAIGFGSFLAIAEAWRNWGNWQWWPFWTVDYIAAALLVIGAMLVWRGAGRVWLAAGWGFTAAMFWMSFFSHLDEQSRMAENVYGPGGVMAEDSMTNIIGIMTAIAFAGLLGALFGKERK